MFSVIDHKLLHNVTMMHYISQQNHSATSHTTRVNHFQKHKFNLNETDGGRSTELSIAKDDCAQLRTGASCNDNTHRVQTLK
jgi:hypothetical protein